MCLPSMLLYPAMGSPHNLIAKWLFKPWKKIEIYITYDFLSLFRLQLSSQALDLGVGLLPGWCFFNTHMWLLKTSLLSLPTNTEEAWGELTIPNDKMPQIVCCSSSKCAVLNMWAQCRSFLLTTWKKEAQCCRDCWIPAQSQELQCNTLPWQKHELCFCSDYHYKLPRPLYIYIIALYKISNEEIKLLKLECQICCQN